MTTPAVTLKDYAWTWFDHRVGSWVTECWACDISTVVPGETDTDRDHAIQVANLHNARHHGE